MPGRRDQPAAIDREIRARDGRRIRPREEGYSLCNFNRLDHAAERGIAFQRGDVPLALVDRAL